MKTPPLLGCLVMGASILLLPAQAQNQAQVHLSSQSIRMHPGECTCGFGLIWKLHFSSLFTEDPALANGEILPLTTASPRNHWSYMVLEDPSMFASATVAELDLPLHLDANGSKGPDFFEVDQAVNVITTGIYSIDWGPGYGQLSFAWTREAGQRRGSCHVDMEDPILGPLGPFENTFDVLEYVGTLTYTPQSGAIETTLQAGNPMTPSEVLRGSLDLSRSQNDRFNLLSAQSGSWASSALVFDFAEFELKRDPARPTVYQGIIPNALGDYPSWRITITDTNDANANGIPDLSDDLGVEPPLEPFITLERNPDGLVLHLEGSIGRTHEVQTASGADDREWETVRTVLQQAARETVNLPFPTNAPSFWRVVVR